MNRFDQAFAEAAVAPLPFAPDAVLFDMDGLLLESERVLLECWRQAARELSLALDDGVFLGMVGHHDAACRAMLVERVGERRTAALVARLQALYDPRVEAGLPVKPGAFALLAWLDARGVPRAVGTSTRRMRALQKLGSTGLLPHFGAVAGGDEVAQAKPAPDIYLLAARRLGVDPARCVVLEDSGPGVRAALAAGALPLQVPDLVPPDAATRALGHRVVASLQQAQALLADAFAAHR